jgi:uncharacterized iron-regulated membrane protein
MKEADLRKWHRTMGIIVALFIILQAGTGLFLSLSDLPVPRNHAHEEAYSTGHDHEEGESLWDDALGFIHHGGGVFSAVYRIVVGMALLMMAVTGSMIFFRIRARSKKR